MHGAGTQGALNPQLNFVWVAGVGVPATQARGQGPFTPDHATSPVYPKPQTLSPKNGLGRLGPGSSVELACLGLGFRV